MNYGFRRSIKKLTARAQAFRPVDQAFPGAPQAP
jgi:hypothetical protein